eukprot:m.127517 g.127517  ORF g.127517 m.127517 type:complete len:529 (-) comp22235_c0_seq1:218-1804(-)
MIPVLGDDGSASGPLCISLAIGLTVAWLFYHTDDNTNDRLPPQPADTTSTSATACTDSSVKVAESCTGMDIGRTVNDAFTNGSKWTASAVSYEEQDKAAEAWQHYNTAAAHFQKGLAIRIPQGAQWDGHRKIQQQMQAYNKSVHGRLTILKKRGIGVKPPDAAAASDPAKNPLFPKRFWKMSGAKDVVQPPAERSASGGRDAHPGAGGPSRTASIPGAPGAKYTAAEESELKAIDEKMWKQIMNEVVQQGAEVSWDSIVGVKKAKEALHEIVILPALNPELFTGLRAPARGLLLFGPPGNGKTMLAKALAHETTARFFNISASTLTSKWMGEGEKLVKALFTIARAAQPSIIFIDEVDSILTKRSEGEHEASRRLKTELLIQFDGVTGSTATRLLVMGATNLPWEIDEAGLRRFTKRIYIRMPSGPDRGELIRLLLSSTKHALSKSDFSDICRKTIGYSNSDLNALARDAALGPIRALGRKIQGVDPASVRPVNRDDFLLALTNIRPSTTSENIAAFDKWADEYGTAA